MALWNVEFSYNIPVEVATADQAEEAAGREWDDIDSTRVEMNVKITELIEEIPK